MDDAKKEMRSYAWQYFSLHASQRISMFNFFLVLTGFLGAGLATCIQGGGILRAAGVALGLFLTIVAFVFYKLDQRTSFFVKHAEGALSKLEADFAVVEARLFTQEVSATAVRSLSSRFHRVWTYGTSFRLVFFVTAVVGLAGAVSSISKGSVVLANPPSTTMECRPRF
jgi:hypothetical protein